MTRHYKPPRQSPLEAFILHLLGAFVLALAIGLIGGGILHILLSVFERASQ